jgi:glycosyltransferase involved in cell wall biosynthesis
VAHVDGTELAPRRRRILLVAYYHPPLNIIGGRRPFALAKYLARAGHDVTVLTTVRNGTPVGPEGARVVAARDLLATRLNWRAGALDTVTGKSDAPWDVAVTPWADVFVPDVQVLSWVPFAVGAARRLRRRLDPELVITTSPTNSTHFVGLALRAAGVPWIADFRDGWTFEPPRDEWPLAIQRRVVGELERTVISRADAVVTVSRPISDHFERQYGVAADTIVNGFDPEDAVAEIPTHATPDPTRLTIAHTGGLGREQSLQPLLDAFRRLADEIPGFRSRLELVLAGAQTSDQQRAYADPSLTGVVRPVGFLERPQALALQRAADVLLVVTSGRRRSEVTGKLLEYLGAGRPILVVGDDSEAARIVTREKVGWAIPARDTAAAETAIRRLLDEGPPPVPAAAAQRYSYRTLAQRYAELIERIIA